MIFFNNMFLNVILLTNQFQSTQLYSFDHWKFYNNSEILFDEIAYEFLSSYFQLSILSFDKFEEEKPRKKIQQIHFSITTAVAPIKMPHHLVQNFVKNRKRKILNVISRVFGWPRGWQHFALQQLIVAGSNLEAANAALKLLHHRS